MRCIISADFTCESHEDTIQSHNIQKVTVYIMEKQYSESVHSLQLETSMQETLNNIDGSRVLFSLLTNSNWLELAWSLWQHFSARGGSRRCHHQFLENLSICVQNRTVHINCELLTTEVNIQLYPTAAMVHCPVSTSVIVRTSVLYQLSRNITCVSTKVCL